MARGEGLPNFLPCGLLRGARPSKKLPSTRETATTPLAGVIANKGADRIASCSHVSPFFSLRAC